jgi:hypothetical protein
MASEEAERWLVRAVPGEFRISKVARNVQVHKTLTAAPSIRSRISRIYHAQPAGFWVVLGVAYSFEAAWFAVLNVGFFYMVVAALTRRSLGYPLLLLVTGAPVVERS